MQESGTSERVAPLEPPPRNANDSASYWDGYFVKILVSVLVIALSVRIFWIFQVRHEELNGDQSIYAEQATALLDFRMWPRYRRFFAPPLYPYLIASTAKLGSALGLDLPIRTSAAIMQTALWLGATALWSVTVRRRVSAAAGLVVAVVLSFWIEQITNSGIVMAEPTAVAFLTLAFACMYWTVGHMYVPRLLLIGFLLGLAVLTKPVVLPLVFAACAVLALRGTGRPLVRVKVAGTLLLATTAVLLPWWSYTYVQTGHVVFGVATGGGFNACLGNHSSSSIGWTQEAVDGVCHTNNPDDPVEDERLRQKAVEWASANLQEQPGLVVMRWDATFGPGSQMLNSFYYPTTWSSWSGPVGLEEVSRIDAFQRRVVQLLGVAGLLVLVLTRRRLGLETFIMAGSVLAIPMLTVGDPRYRAPLVPFLALWAAYALAVALPEGARRLLTWARWSGRSRDG